MGFYLFFSINLKSSMHCLASLTSWTLKILLPFINAYACRKLVPLRDSWEVVFNALYIMDFLDIPVSIGRAKVWKS